jgi:putative Mg2+ transporter-C (MgtC) family protein
LSIVFTAAASPAANTLDGQGWRQAGELGIALLLSAVIGLEREVRGKDAGLRTHCLVGLGSALFVLISKYGFTDVLERQLITLDPSRMAAQIISGIGFLGAGVIFVRRDVVRGLTTAAGIWVTAAVGAAAGAGLPVLAALAAAGYLIITLGLPVLRRRLPLLASKTGTLNIRYPDGRGMLRTVISETTSRGYVIDALSTEPSDGQRASGRPPDEGQPSLVMVRLRVHGKRPVSELAGALTDLELVQVVDATSDYTAADE